MVFEIIFEITIVQYTCHPVTAHNITLCIYCNGDINSSLADGERIKKISPKNKTFK